ncbi:MAG: LLM class F420-dependent oxidoreductase, partial [Myxococcales bacterium]|nr:LLM class F420-dependent oxidoreductase [Myxococcales bacterium]
VVRTCLVADASHARALARHALDFYVDLPAYHRTWKQAGFEESDFADGGSDRLVDAIFAWGGERQVRERIQAHIDAGADEICLYPVNPREELAPGQVGGLEPDWEVLEVLAPGG